MEQQPSFVVSPEAVSAALAVARQRTEQVALEAAVAAYERDEPDEADDFLGIALDALADHDVPVPPEPLAPTVRTVLAALSAVEPTIDDHDVDVGPDDPSVLVTTLVAPGAPCAV